MKKLLLGALSIFALAANVSAQDGIEIHIDGAGAGADVSGTVVQRTITDAGNLEVKFYVTNNTGSDEQWRITRVIQTQPPSNWFDQVCWPPQCYLTQGAQSYVTPSTQGNPAPTITNGSALTTNSQDAILKPIVVHGSVGGNAKYMYYITDNAGNFVDSVGLEISSTLGINDPVASLSVNVSPNPASNAINVSTEGANNATVKIVDVLGNVVLSERAISSYETIDVSKFKNSIYFVMVEAEGIKPVIRRVIVRH